MSSRRRIGISGPSAWIPVLAWTVSVALAAGSPHPPGGGDAEPELGPVREALRVFSHSAEKVFRGRCVAAEAGHLEIAGARLPVTTYRFEVGETLKGPRTATLTFRQVGTPGGGAADLGRRAGLRVYQPGREYLVFLLPESRLGLTSPAGAGEAVFALRDDELVPVQGGHGLQVMAGGGDKSAASLPAEAGALDYDAVRRAVLEDVR